MYESSEVACGLKLLIYKFTRRELEATGFKAEDDRRRCTARAIPFLPPQPRNWTTSSPPTTEVFSECPSAQSQRPKRPRPSSNTIASRRAGEQASRLPPRFTKQTACANGTTPTNISRGGSGHPYIPEREGVACTTGDGVNALAGVAAATRVGFEEAQ